MNFKIVWREKKDGDFFETVFTHQLSSAMALDSWKELCEGSFDIPTLHYWECYRTDEGSMTDEELRAMQKRLYGRSWS